MFLIGHKFCLGRVLQVPAAYSPVDPDAPPMLSTYFMKKCNLQYILVENDKVKVSAKAIKRNISCGLETCSS